MRFAPMVLVLGALAVLFVQMGTRAATATPLGGVLFVVLTLAYGLAVRFAVRGRQRAFH